VTGSQRESQAVRAPGGPAQDASALAPDVPIVLAASACWETPAPVTVHQIAVRLAERGHPVLFVESTGLRAPAPLASRLDLQRLTERASRWLGGVREVQPGLHVVAPVAPPFVGPRWLRAAGMRLLASTVKRTLRRLGFDRPILWAFLRRLVVYQCVDHYAGNPGVDAEWLDGLEACMLERADLVIATSGVLVERLRRIRADVELSENVADVGLFARAVTEELSEPPGLQALPRPRLVYVGNVAGYRVDFELLLAAAQALPDVPLLLIGVVGLGDVRPLPPAWHRLAGLPNVHVLGPRPQPELPAFLRHCDVALIPFPDNAHTRGSLPLKLWEYLAAGLPVVATDLPNFAKLSAEGTIRTARGPAAFVAAIREALEEPQGRRRERLARARAHDWPARMEVLCGLLADRLSRGAGGADRGSGSWA
jgi:glycosyltransferase involved in cell wall biosynthesis